MPKPPNSPPHSDIDGVNRDGTRPSKKLVGRDDGTEELEHAAREDSARPDYSDDSSGDDRTR
ncbi:MAG: hypothetical protein ACK4SZ_16525 [Allosphingosinicella sp.]|uniref:hypothetical protein n=1 Tax=Allosphingosinicella sp. TaxID=2823234 RepID=UPI00395CF85E